MSRILLVALTESDQVASWGYAITLFLVANQVGVDVVKVDPLVAAAKCVEVSHRCANTLAASL